MRLKLPSLVLCVPLALLACASGSAEPGVSAWSDEDLDSVLERFVSADGLVDYEALADDRGRLDRYVEALERFSPDSHPALFPGRSEQLAYWMNAYNALMLRRVVDAWPVASVRDIRVAYGVFWMERHTLGGESWTLRGLENKIIRRRFAEPRIHFAINCASTGCPALPQRAWRAESLDEDLNAAARRFIADPRNVRLDDDARVIYLSSIFKWFDEDFTDWLAREGHPPQLLDYVALHLQDSDRQRLEQQPPRIEFRDYDWSINARRPPPG